MAQIRLDKFLCDLNIGTRSEVKKLLKTGMVTVNGNPEKQSDRKLNLENDTVAYNGKILTYEKYVYYILNKPAGVVSATNDNTCQTVVDLLKKEGYPDLFPVGRLDKDTEGFLLLTNDGELAHNLLSPKKHVDKTYYAEVDADVTHEDCEAFEKGMDIGNGETTLPAKLQICEHGTHAKVLVTIQEGKYHQVKRMFEAVGKHVLYLKRISMGNMQLPADLKTGEYRRLTSHELLSIQKKTGFCDTEF